MASKRAPTFRTNDGYAYRLTGRSTSRSRAWLAFDENGNQCGVLYWKHGSISKRSATKMLKNRWPYAETVRGAKRISESSDVL